jgi:hypothetical protein
MPELSDKTALPAAPNRRLRRERPGLPDCSSISAGVTLCVSDETLEGSTSAA